MILFCMSCQFEDQNERVDKRNREEVWLHVSKAVCQGNGKKNLVCFDQRRASFTSVFFYNFTNSVVTLVISNLV
jgi:hypothetical protein